jgi:uncharacterized protein
LLSDGPGNFHDSEFDIPTVRISDDLLVKYIRGPLRLSRTKEGILIQATLQIGVEAECFRCLDPIAYDIPVVVEELYAYMHPIESEFTVLDDGILDLGPLLRAEVLIATSHRTLCRPDCKGLCPEWRQSEPHGLRAIWMPSTRVWPC